MGERRDGLGMVLTEFGVFTDYQSSARNKPNPQTFLKGEPSSLSSVQASTFLKP